MSRNLSSQHGHSLTLSLSKRCDLGCSSRILHREVSEYEVSVSGRTAVCLLFFIYHLLYCAEDMPKPSLPPCPYSVKMKNTTCKIRRNRLFDSHLCLRTSSQCNVVLFLDMRFVAVRLPIADIAASSSSDVNPRPWLKQTTLE